MINPGDKEYTQTKRILEGIEKMNPAFIPLAEWIDRTYDVKTVNIIHDLLHNGRPRIQICFEFEKEMNQFLTHGVSYFDKEKQTAIGKKFSELIAKERLNKQKNSFLNCFKSKRDVSYLTDDVFVIYGAFDRVAKMEVINSISENLINQFTESLNNEDIWTVSRGLTVPTFFMYSDAKVNDYDTPEIRAMWADKYYAFIKLFDTFNYFKREDVYVSIDSKENFDENYQSNWYYYYK